MEFEWGLIRQLHPFYWKNNIYFGIYLACLLVLFFFRKREGWRDAYRTVFWYSIVAMIVVCYNPVFTRLTFSRLFWYDMIDRDLEEGERCYAIVPSTLDETYGSSLVTNGMRQYDSNIVIDTTFPMEISEAEISDGEFRTYLEDVERNTERDYGLPVYVLCLTDDGVVEAMKSYGYRQLGETEHFSVMTKG